MKIETLNCPVKCNSPKTECPRHGKCCECVTFHRDLHGNIPYCLKAIAGK